jgi:DNA-binding beta-propeller fold protein YncE
MERFLRLGAATAVAAGLALSGTASQAEILALVNYESKPADALKAFATPVRGQTRIEGIAIIDVDPQSPSFGDIVKDIELPADLVAHHVFYNRDSSKAYVTSLGKGELQVIDMNDESMSLKTIEVAECEVGEDVVFSEDNARWYLTCMGSDRVIIGDAVKDEMTQVVDLPKPYAHGIAIHDGIDRILVTSTVRPSDLGDPGDAITVLKASTGEVLGTHRVSNKPEPGGEAPVEIVFVPGSNPPLAYITNMYGASLWTATWNPATDDFEVAEAFNLAEQDVGVPLEIYFNDDSSRMYVTTAKPGHMHIFDISADPAKPKLMQSIATAEGAHHIAFNKDMSLGWVQNSLINLPGMSDGSISVVDLKEGKVIASIDTFKNDGLNPNSIILMPEWNNPAGH